MFSTLKTKAKAHEDGIWACSYASSTRIVTGSVDNTLKIWDAESLECLHTLSGHHALGVISVDVSSDGYLCVSNSLDAIMQISNITTGQHLKSIDAGPGPEAWKCVMSADGKTLIAGAYNGNINFYNIESGLKESSLETRGKFIMSISASADGKFLAAGSESGAVHVFDLQTRKMVHSFAAHKSNVRALAFSPNCQLLATGGDDKMIHVYGIPHGNLICSLTGHSSWVLSLSFRRDSVHLASGSSDKSVKVWSVQSKQCVHTFDAHQDQVWAVGFSPDGTRLVSVGDDCAMIVCSVNP